ncbi:hypothetical protein [Nostoc punctiforme]|uniref:hypothetical protein n=1 Tax=Nostoc punctiforme TaxID=272131 RepID=UPI0002ED9EA8|nr:hypothetical protein [Nostoc punctiforme]
MPKNSGFFGFGVINKNNSAECHASYHGGLLKFFAAFRMTTEHQITSAANQFFVGDAVTSKGSTTKLALDVSK